MTRALHALAGESNSHPPDDGRVVTSRVEHGTLRLSAVIGNHMVLQRGQPIPIWGWAERGEKVAVAIAGQSHSAHAGDDGRWKIVLDKLEVGPPLALSITGSSGSMLALKNLIVGEVWLCSGQSNMARGIGMFDHAEEEIAAADYSQIRLFHVPEARASSPALDVNAAWSPCSPQTIVANGRYPGRSGFSAVAYHFGRRLHKELGVPIGLIDASLGSTPAEFWINRMALEGHPATQSLAQGESSCLYNGMIAPLIPFAIRGAIWYQGEANVERASQYRTLFPALIRSWRTDWRQGCFPFYFVQIAPYRYSELDPQAGAQLREAQTFALESVPKTGMVVTMDIGDATDIHPQNKQEVGRRLALWALADVYGHNLVCSGPMYRSMAVVGDAIWLAFDHVGGGLIASDGLALTDFAIAGANRQFVPAVAEIREHGVVVRSDRIAEPVAVRFAWRDDAMPNLANKEGLPASPFRTDSWKEETDGSP